VEWLRAIGESLVRADVPEERAELVHAIYERIIVAGRTIVQCPSDTGGPCPWSSGSAPGSVRASPPVVSRWESCAIRCAV
jgi:hypothetical protein